MKLGLRITAAVWLISFFGVSARAAGSEQPEKQFTLRAYPARWVLPAAGDTLIIPRLRLSDLAEESWEVVVFKNAKRGCIISPQAIFTEAEIHSATSIAGMASEKPVLEVQLNSEGGKALSTYSSQETSIGQPIAIQYGKRWVSFPKLQAHLAGGRAVLLGLTEQEAAAIISSFESRPD